MVFHIDWFLILNHPCVSGMKLAWFFSTDALLELAHQDFIEDLCIILLPVCGDHPYLFPASFSFNAIWFDTDMAISAFWKNLSVASVITFPTFHSKTVFILTVQMCVLWKAERWILFPQPLHHSALLESVVHWHLEKLLIQRNIIFMRSLVA